MITSLEYVKNISVYHYDACPFCAKTRRLIDDFSLKVELKNIEKNHQHRIDISHGGHKTQVPCLRIEQSNGDSKWLYESNDIIYYLAQHQNELLRLILAT